MKKKSFKNLKIKRKKKLLIKAKLFYRMRVTGNLQYLSDDTKETKITRKKNSVGEAVFETNKNCEIL